MRSPEVVPVDDCVARLERFDAIIDVRSPSEFALDHLPGAINLPVLDDAERALVGTIDAKQSPFEARRVGAAIASRRIAEIVAGPLADRGPQWRPLVYCWRGGNRSGSLATVLARIGWRTAVIDGGYRAFRRHVVGDIAARVPTFRFLVLAGRTGVAKSAVLDGLRAGASQVLDLERLAQHRGSVLGAIPGHKQPSQKAFETRLWSALRDLDPAHPVIVESESRKIGACQLPDALIHQIRASPCIVIEAPLAFRVRFLLAQYEHFDTDPVDLSVRLDALVALHGRETVARWQSLVARGRLPELVEDLLVAHYDPAYDRSMRRNFKRLDEASVVRPDPAAPAESIDAVVASLTARTALAAGRADAQLSAGAAGILSG